MAQTTRSRIHTPALVPTEQAIPEREEPAGVDLGLSTRVAFVKLILAGLNIVAILIDDSVPAAKSPAALIQSMTVATLFFLYMLVSYLSLRRRWVSQINYRLTAPFVDVAFSALLILGTDGYQSPFNLWLAMSLVAAGFSSNRRIFVSATAFALLLQAVIALIPQGTPIDIRVFTVRTSFIFCFGLMIAYIGNHIARNSMMLATIDNFALAVGKATTVSEAAQVFLDHFAPALNARSLELDLDAGGRFTRGEVHAKDRVAELPVTTGRAFYGTLTVGHPKALAPEDLRFAHTLVDRFAITLRRIMAGDELKNNAAQEARLWLADELHDTHVQTLAAIDFQIQALFAKPGLTKPIKTDLQRIRDLARQSIVGIRAFLSKGPIESSNDLDEIIARCRRSWQGELDYDADDVSGLSRAGWAAVEVMLREGLANARMHARSTWARFTIRRKDGMLIATLETDGPSPDLPIRKYGYGLSRLAAAIAGAGGTMSIAARPEGGAMLSAAFGEMQFD